MITAALVFSACGETESPADILPADKMKLVLWDYICADIYASEIKAKDSSRDLPALIVHLQEEAFKKNKTDRAVFNKSFTWYESNSSLMKPLLDSMISQKSREMEKKRLQMLKITS